MENVEIHLPKFIVFCYFLRNIRENWIKAKYVEKRFVKKLPEITTQRMSRSSNVNIRKWSVRKIRRRTKSCDNYRKNRRRLQSPDVLKEAITKNEIREVEEASPSSPSVGSEFETNLKRNRSSILLFGGDLEKHPLDGSLDLSSDQDSTEGEEEPLGECR